MKNNNHIKFGFCVTQVLPVRRENAMMKATVARIVTATEYACELPVFYVTGNCFAFPIA